MVEFVHLHVHSDFSLLDGAASVEALAAKAASLGMKHLAITDHGNMFGALKFRNACLGDKDHPLKDRAPVHPIIGSEFYMAPGSRTDRKGGENGNKYYHLILLATNEEGYRNLMKLSSYSYTEGFYYKPRIDRELLEKYHAGLICLSACLAGEIPSLILRGQIQEAEKTALWFNSLFGQDNFYLEVQDHRIPEQRQVNPIIVEIAGRTGIPLVATNDIHYIEKEDSIAQDLLLCIGTQAKRGDEKRMRFDTDEFYFKTGDEMAALFPEAQYPGAIANTVRIAERCKTEIPSPGPLLPDFAIPEGYANADEYLRRQTMEGMEKRYPAMDAEVVQRAEYELGVIISMGFTGYFLIVADFINWAKEHDIPVGPGRGSGAGSIVAYALRITNNDPIKYKLLFERFLNPERISMPDFDVDFANEGRQDVIDYVTEKYGKEKVGQIITFGTMKAKAAVKDVARALDISIDESNMLTKLIPEDPKMTLKKAFEQEPRLRELEQEPKYQELFAMARKLEGKNRNSSIHASGIVIGKTDLTDYVPLYQDKSGAVASQYTMDLIEPQGLVKMDFLGLKTLDLIDHSVKLIRRRGGEYAAFDIETISETGTAESDAVFKMLGEGKSYGVFQFESEGMQKVLKDAQPTSIEDLIALNALYRPGPMDNIPQFIASKHGRQAIVYPDPSLEGILKETYGVIVYQEQVMQVAQIIAGYSLGQADILRRAMGKKKREILDKEKVPFIAGALKRGFKEADADRIFEILAPFAGYGFNKSHAAAYAVLAYQTAYLKANFPVEFMAANMSNEISSVDKLPLYIDEARRMGISIDPPDINRSDRLFTVVDGRIVYGFVGIKGLGDGSAEEIINCRKDGPYKSFMDYLDRVNIKTVGKKVTEILARTGAFDSFGQTRQTLIQNLETAVDHAQNKKADKELGQASLFDDTDEQAFPDYKFTIHPEMDREEKLNIEKELIGFYFSGHPLDDYKEEWEKFVKLDLSDPDNAPERDYTLIGILKTLKPYTNKSGRAMAFASLSDYRGEIDIVFFEKPWESCRDKIAEGDKIVLKGRLDKSRGKASLRVESILSPERLKIKEDLLEYCSSGHPLDDFAEAWEQFVKLDLSKTESAPEEEYTLIGMLTSLRPITTKAGKDMAFGSLADYRGEIDLVFFTRAWTNSKEKLIENQCVALKGKLDKSREKPSFQVSSVLETDKLRKKAAKNAAPTEHPGEEAGPDTETLAAQAAGNPGQGGGSPDVVRAPVWRELHIRLKTAVCEREENLYPLRDYLYDNSGPCSVFIHVPEAAETATVDSGGKVAAETVIRAAAGIGVSADAPCIEALSLYAAVAEVWGA
ncbi:DNA polymerase III subunit alpha [Treponema primitia ZAS-2]|uniref:DNA polymerase III subunit alpha n=1 Tax=Treponema primitia (strain ATCC BAA-887 / DSM 12427 / ZAS-2) TaxID=545694 RepID=F5YPM1_TREPZ|nr:DNA polymerase III subunit alpha [Treponema primitia]AEF84747.1 DNA polymerase III subunit alpha [Treponema primitia ZAS-2]